MRLIRCLCVLPALVITAAPAPAQTAQRFSVQGSGLYAGLFGDAFGEIEDGLGGEIQLRFTPGALSIGGGFQFTAHNTAGDARDILTKVRLSGVFLEPRYVFDVGAGYYAPYVSGRFALSRMSFTVASAFNTPNVRLEFSEPSGPTINAGGGLLFRLNRRANLDVGVTYGYTEFENITGTIVGVQSGERVDFAIDVGSGSNVVMRVGLAIGLGG